MNWIRRVLAACWRPIRLAGRLLLVPVYWSACLMPRSDSIWLCGAWFGRRYMDNPKYIFRQVRRTATGGIKAYFIVKDRAYWRQLRERGEDVVLAQSLRGIWLHLRCGAVVFTHSAFNEFIACLLGASVKRVQTWHGIPIKKIGYDEGIIMGRERVRVLRQIYPFMSDRCDLVLASGSVDAEIYKTAFNVEPQSIVITGYARNDLLHPGACDLPARPTVHREWRVIYMPTLRGGPGSDFPLLEADKFDADRWGTVLREINCKMYIRLHPVQVLPEATKACLMGHGFEMVPNSDDFYEHFAVYDVLISDYSGAMFDFMLTKKPIIVAAVDYVEYQHRDRQVYYDLSTVAPSKPCETWSEVFEQLRGMRDNPPVYDEITRRFHGHQDGRNSERAVEAISRLMANRGNGWPTNRSP